MSNSKLSDYVTIAEASRLVGVAQNTLRAWADAGKVEVRRNPANGYRIFKRSELAAFLAQVEASAAPRPKPR